MVRLVLVWVIVLALTAGCAPAPAYSLQFDQIEPPFISLALESPSASRAHRLVLHVELDNAPDQSLLLALFLTYPDGQAEQVLKTVVHPGRNNRVDREAVFLDGCARL